MVVRQITVSYGRTVNLGSYENVKVEVSEVVDLGPDESPESAHDGALARLINRMARSISMVRG